MIRKLLVIKVAGGYANDMTAVRKTMTGALPSFSTPGFVKPKPSPAISAPKRDVVVVSSSESTPTSPFGKLPIKRSSSDSTLSSEHSPSSKRVRKEVVANKENLNLLELRPRENGKSKARERGRSRGCNETKDEPWQRMELDKEPNPFARLDRDYPQHAARSASPAKVVEPINHSDLNSVCLPRFRSPLLYLTLILIEIFGFVEDTAMQ